MLRSLVLMVLAMGVLLPASHVFAFEVADVVITTAVVDREPVDKVEVFPIQNGKLYCFTRIVGADEPTLVYHAWYRGEQLMSRVELPVNSSHWRTWSAKRFLADQPGEWRVEIQDVDGNVLRKVGFVLR
jgi:hypothetical protein